MGNGGQIIWYPEFVPLGVIVVALLVLYGVYVYLRTERKLHLPAICMALISLGVLATVGLIIAFP